MGSEDLRGEKKARFANETPKELANNAVVEFCIKLRRNQDPGNHSTTVTTYL